MGVGALPFRLSNCLPWLHVLGDLAAHLDLCPAQLPGLLQVGQTCGVVLK